MEWNYLPGNSWSALSRSSPARDRESFYAAMSGAPGGAFVAASLLELQDAPVAMAYLFHGEAGAFGLFNEHGVPYPVWDAVFLFGQLMRTPRRVAGLGGVPGQRVVAAGLNAAGTEAGVLIVRTRDDPEAKAPVRLAVRSLPWTTPTALEIRRMPTGTVDTPRAVLPLESDGMVLLPDAAPSVVWIGLRPAAP